MHAGVVCTLRDKRFPCPSSRMPQHLVVVGLGRTTWMGNEPMTFALSHASRLSRAFLYRHHSPSGLAFNYTLAALRRRLVNLNSAHFRRSHRRHRNL